TPSASPLHISSREADLPPEGGDPIEPSGGMNEPSRRLDAVLDNPAWSSLTGHHADLAVGNELVRRFPEDVSPFVGIKDWDHPDVWDAILDVFGHDATVGVSHADPLLPEGWSPVFSIPGVQLVQTDRLRARPDD